MKSARPYTMRARAAGAEQTRTRVLDAAAKLMSERLRSDIRLDDVATNAGVTVQTVLRVFGSKQKLFAAALDHVLADMAAELRQAEPGDVAGSVRTWFDHYEKYGDVVLGNLADERDPAVAPIVGLGRERHRAHVEAQLAPLLARYPAAGRRRLVDALVCVCDVYTWKLLRRDMGRSRAEAEATMSMMINAVLGG
ncbi:TetR/AcrR family transcriptional regulator [Amycolatopsis sp. NPDC059021]|uniref:TetR/AcrR family transcriptional regulator n=1 Tax=Amycolatopsis sp. NPDC059021 TaxID=3346704 RepID=UPI00366CB779